MKVAPRAVADTAVEGAEADEAAILITMSRETQYASLVLDYNILKCRRG